MQTSFVPSNTTMYGKHLSHIKFPLWLHRQGMGVVDVYSAQVGFQHATKTR